MLVLKIKIKKSKIEWSWMFCDWSGLIIISLVFFLVLPDFDCDLSNNMVVTLWVKECQVTIFTIHAFIHVLKCIWLFDFTQGTITVNCSMDFLICNYGNLFLMYTIVCHYVLYQYHELKTTRKENLSKFMCTTYSWNKGGPKLFHLQIYSRTTTKYAS